MEPVPADSAEADAACAELAAMAELSGSPIDDEHLLALLDELPDDPGEERLRALVSATGFTLETFLAPGGGWNGSETPARRGALVGTRNGLTVTSTKRNWGNTGSDHHTSQRSSFAVDLSNGTAPTVEMQRVANRIAAAMGYRFPDNGYLQTATTSRGYRAQLIYNSTVVPDHENHVHFGVRKVR
ncbi:hypothetical protein DQ237_10240 [Blastococcus sp. TF02-8]|uniref:hypothetical protein n=1 Tax=Blastococcus sp. TF02-8 TaxID=2250574 RepID=UPI000DE8D1CC|nr:hypothetical protein [Blastococcus sp. TF02-8]RBY96232.1 hypothetical protein DQ237_10240 [Blastococcus sp. TF02-8]